MVETSSDPADIKLSSLAQQISNRWPGREQQISRLVSLISRNGSYDPNILIYGPASTGKTSIIRSAGMQVLHALEQHLEVTEQMHNLRFHASSIIGTDHAFC